MTADNRYVSDVSQVDQPCVALYVDLTAKKYCSACFACVVVFSFV